MAPDAAILPVRVLDEDGAGTVSTVAEGIRRAADRRDDRDQPVARHRRRPARACPGQRLPDAIRYAWGKGKIPVLAAGNDGVFGGLFGSGYGDLPAVVVTATDRDDRAAPYATSIGSAMWGVAAPGGDASGEEGRDILSAFPDRRCALEAGTSMAAPHVSGALAALRARGLSPQQAVDRLLSTARDLGSASTYGHGLIDLAARRWRTARPLRPRWPPPPDAGGHDRLPRRAAPGHHDRAARAPTTPPSSSGDPVAASTPGAATSEDTVADEAGPARGRTTTTVDRSPPEESAAGAVVRDLDEDDDGVPGALVAVAVAALAVMRSPAPACSHAASGRRP